jgi:hypothetical protein
MNKTMKLKEKLSMPCTEKQWTNEIEPRLKELGVNITSLFSFERYPYITNNFESNNKWTGTPNVSNILGDWCFDRVRIFIPYDADRFIDSFIVEGGIDTQDFTNVEAVFLSKDGAIVSPANPHIAVKNVTHKFEDRTTTGSGIDDIIEWQGIYIVKLKYYTPKLFYTRTLESVNERFFGALIPRNHEKDALKQQIEEKEKELKELKDKLNKL